MAESKASANYVVTIYNTVLQTVAYVAAYFVLTATGRVPRGQLSSICRSTGGGCRWGSFGLAKYLLIAGACDVADNVTGFTAEPHLSTLTFALMNQATVPFTVAFTLCLGVRYSACELVSVLVVVCAAAGCVLIGQFAEASHGSNTTRLGAGAAAPPHEDSPSWAVFAALTTSFAAVSFLLKEHTFRSYATAGAKAAQELSLIHI